MDGGGLLQVLVTLAAVALAGLVVYRSYRKPKNNSQGFAPAQTPEGAPGDERAEAPEGGAPDAPGHGRAETPEGAGPGAPGDGRAEAPEGGGPDAPGHGRAEAPEGGAPDAPGDGRAEAPEDEAVPKAAPRAPWLRSDSLAIRREAWRLFRAQFWRILPLSALVMAVSAALNTLESWMSRSEDLSLLVALIPLLISPFAANGSAYAALHVWRGEKPRLRMLFSFLRPRRYFRAIGLIILQGLAMLLPGMILFTGLTVWARDLAYADFGDGPQIGSLLVALLGGVVMAWLGLRFSILYYALARRPDRPVGEAFETGFRATGRRLGAVIGTILCTEWPVIAMAVALLGIVRTCPALGAPFYSGIFAAFYALYGGYIWLSMAGLADRLLADEEARRVSPEGVPAAQSGGKPGEDGTD